MASGFEVIGLALAVFPVLVEGLKFYMEKKGRVRDFIRYRHVLKRIIRDLSREQISFRNSSQRFLEDVSMIYGLSPNDIHEMMRDPQDNRWRKEIPFQGDDLKERSVAVYLETVEDMNEALKGIQDMVGIREDAPPALLGKSTFRRQWSKIILVIGEEDIRKHLDRARGLNVFLSQLTEQNKPRVPAGGLLQRSTLHYEQIQAHAIELYEIFQIKFSTPLTCNCALGHTVNMKLEFRSAQILTAKGLHFHTIFTFDHVEPDITPPCNWREIEMEPLGSSRLCLDRQILHKAVTLTVESSAIQTTDPTVSEISNLCAVIKRPIETGVWLGYLTDSQCHRHRVRVLALDSLPVASYTIQTISLAAVLDHREFRQESRCRLGLKLASSVMQLHATQWLANHWNKTDISFPLFSDGKIDFNNPLIKRSFGSKDETGSSASVTPNYKKVLKRCIGGLDAAFESLEQGALKDEVEQKIILPLEEDLKFYCDKNCIADCV
ncbi:hypothetical protein PENARI_c054G09299 [Penicillium arizonense]|uniref:DUF7580 domain-containing protein n=1 Tax=Penicillium arizonense TaxID=1835702 RepID=A0A1F5L1Y7_PENAI|nr:hypothetical protein PENARI_c054G09299 [Penicillium arizonense]OGE47224.1 hypothetical protein PENARI_c054G09299 [Penicillium arizonense]